MEPIVILAEVIAKGRTVHNLPRQVGDVVEVDANTFRNLVADGVLKAAEPEKPAKGKKAAE